MPISACSNGLVLTAALLTFLLLPVERFLPRLDAPVLEKKPVVYVPEPPAPVVHAPVKDRLWPFDVFYFQTLDLIFTFALVVFGILTYMCEWIQRKIMERRIKQLNQLLVASLDKLRAWDVQQEQLEATLRLVRNATAEYNLLLLLLLRQHGCLAQRGPPSRCFFDKDKDAELDALFNPVVA
ncbi:hypothetical protein NE865_15273 [Phthorimaea operculella]|nr:hypothetical protein NE865_15273 [Phthorimaea operculella]